MKSTKWETRSYKSMVTIFCLKIGCEYMIDLKKAKMSKLEERFIDAT